VHGEHSPRSWRPNTSYFGVVEKQRLLVDISDHWRAPSMYYRFRGSNESHRGHNHFVPLLQPRGAEGERQRVGTRPTASSEQSSHPTELLLEAGAGRTTYKGTAMNNVAKGLFQLWTNRCVQSR